MSSLYSSVARGAVLALLLAGGAAAMPSSALASPDTTKVLSSAESVTEDAQAVAALAGVSVAEARNRLTFQTGVSRFIDSIPADVLTASYAGSSLSFSSGHQATLYFKGQVPAKLSGAPAGVQLVGGMRHSFDQLTERQNAVHAALAAQGFRDISSATDIATQHITVDVTLQPARPGLRGKAIRDATLAALAERTALGANDFSIVEHAAGRSAVVPEHGYGGAGFRDDGVRECTSGFVVRRNSDGVEGVLTDSHCEGLNQLEENNTSGGVNLSFSAPFVSEHIGVNGDMEWHTTTHDDFPQFWSSNSSRRNVNARIGSSGYSVGGYTCHYGRFSGYSCGNIATLTRSVTFTWAGCNCLRTAQNLVGTTGATSTGGDSGGPWFLVNTAYGLHWGQAFGERLFSRIQRAENQFGVSVQFA